MGTRTTPTRRDIAWIQSWTEPPASYREAYEQLGYITNGWGGQVGFSEFMDTVGSSMRCLSEEVVADLLESHGVARALFSNRALTPKLARQVEAWCTREIPGPEASWDQVSGLGALVSAGHFRKKTPALSRSSVEWLRAVCSRGERKWDENARRAFRLLLEVPGVVEEDWVAIIESWKVAGHNTPWDIEARKILSHPAAGTGVARSLASCMERGRMLPREFWSSLIRVPGAYQDREVWGAFRRTAGPEAWQVLFATVPPEEQARLWREELKRAHLSPVIGLLSSHPERLPALLGEGEVGEANWLRLASADEPSWLKTLCRAATGKRFQEAFRRLLHLSFPLAVELLRQGELRPDQRLEGADLAPLLHSSDQEVRLLGISTLGAMAISASPPVAVETPSRTRT